MIRYAAVSSAGHRAQRADRDAIDAWAKDRCSAGESVDVFAGAPDPLGRTKLGITLVGRWEPIGEPHA